MGSRHDKKGKGAYVEARIVGDYSKNERVRIDMDLPVKWELPEEHAFRFDGLGAGVHEGSSFYLSSDLIRRSIAKGFITRGLEDKILISRRYARTRITMDAIREYNAGEGLKPKYSHFVGGDSNVESGGLENVADADLDDDIVIDQDLLDEVDAKSGSGSSIDISPFKED